MSDYIKIVILKELNRSDEALSLNGLRTKIGGVNYSSVKRNCEFLRMIGLIKIEVKVLEKKTYNFISITDSGRSIVNCLE